MRSVVAGRVSKQNKSLPKDSKSAFGDVNYNAVQILLENCLADGGGHA